MVRNFLWMDFSAGQRLVFILTALLVGIGFICRALTRIQDRNESRSPPDGPTVLADVKCPDQQESCPGTDNGERFEILGYSQQTISYEFGKNSEFILHQLVQELDGYEENAYNYVRITGVTHIRPAQGKIENNLRVDLLITASDPQLSYVEKTDSQLVIRTPRGISKHSWDSRGSDKPYVRIDATIWVSPGAILQNFDINVQSLSIVCYTGLKLNARRVMLSTLTGHITLPPDHAELITTDSREIIIHSTFGSIEGTYPLYDLLSITTVSGSISILISPQEALDSNTKPAKLILQSASGSIQADTPVAELTESKRLRKIPHRDYTSSVSSASGSIYANILHTSKTTIQTASGRISAYIHPHGPPSLPSLLVTDSASSATNVKVYPSLSHPLIPLQALSASHRVFSGSINLTYPNEWEGSIHAKTISGTLRVDWPRVNIVKDVKGVVGREIEALRGHGQGRLEFETTSGSAFLGGDGEPG